MATLRQALGPQLLPQSLNSQLGGGGRALTHDEVENNNAEIFAHNSGALRQGVQRGYRGVTGPTNAWIGGGLEAGGNDPAAQAYYAQAQREAELAQIESQGVPSWVDAHGPGGIANFVAGNIGAMAPMMAPALVTGGLGRAVGGNTGAMVGATASMHPMMAGGAIERMRADPVTAALSPQERWASGNVEGLGSAALYATVPAALQGRAVGAAGLAAKPSLNPLKTVSGIAQDTGAGMIGMGAANVAVGELGRANQRSYNPAYQVEGGDDAARTEEFMSGVAGIAPIAAGHGVMAHTVGAARKPGQEFLGAVGDLAVGAGKKTWSVAKDAAGKAIPAKARDAYGAIKDLGDGAGEAFDNSLADSALNNAASGEGMSVGDHGRATGALVRQVASNVTGAAKSMSESVSNAIGKKIEGTTAGDVIEKLGAIIKDPAKAVFDPTKDDAANVKVVDMTSKAAVQEAIGRVNTLIEQYSLNGESVNRFRMIEAKVRGGRRLSPDDRATLGQAVENIGKISSPVEHLNEIAGPAEKGGPESRAKKQSAEDQAMHREFGDDVHSVAKELFADHPLAEDQAHLYAASHALEDALTKIARGVKAGGVNYGARARKLGEYLIGTFGDKGNEAVGKLSMLAAARFGADSAQAQRVARIDENRNGVHQLVASLTDPRKDKAGNEAKPLLNTGGKKTSDVVHGMLDELRRARNEDATRPSTAQLDALLESARKVQSEPGGEARAYALRKQALELRASGKAVDALRAKWVGEGRIKGEDFERVASKIEDYERHADRLDKPQQASPYGQDSGTRASKVGESDDIVVKPRREESDEDGLTIQEKADAETGTQNEHSVTHHGAEGLRAGKHDANKVQTPVSRTKAADFTDKDGQVISSYQAVRDAVDAKYGHRVAADEFVNVLDWAREHAGESGQSEKELLKQAMHAVLSHDASRKKRLEGITDRNTAADLRAIETRADHAQNVGEHAAEFFKAHKGYGYYRLAQHQGENLAYSAKELRRVGPQGEETPAGYAARMLRQAKEAGDYVWSKSVYENSLLPVILADGATTHVDLPQLVERAMRHQAADVEGVGANRRNRAVDPNGEVSHEGSSDYKKGTLNALYTVAAAIMDAKGVNGENAFGHQTGEGKMLTGLSAKKKGREAVLSDIFAPNLVVTRDAVNGRVVTFGQLTKLLGVDAQTMRITKDGVLHITQPDGSVKHVSTTPGVMDSVALRRIVKTGSEKADLKGSPAKGVLENALTDAKGATYDLNMRAMLAHMVERNDIDLSRALAGGELPDNLAAALIRDGLKELAAHGYKMDMTAHDKGDARNAWGEAKLFSRSYEQGGEYKSYDVTWNKLRTEADPSVNKPVPRTLEDARLADLRDKLAALEKPLAEREQRMANGELAPRGTDADPRSAEYQEWNKKRSSYEFEAGRPEDRNEKANAYRPEDTDNSRVQQILGELKKLSGDEGALFDKSTQKLFNDAFDHLKTWEDHIADPAAIGTKKGEWSRTLAKLTAKFDVLVDESVPSGEGRIAPGDTGAKGGKEAGVKPTMRSEVTATVPDKRVIAAERAKEALAKEDAVVAMNAEKARRVEMAAEPAALVEQKAEVKVEPKAEGFDANKVLAEVSTMTPRDMIGKLGSMDNAQLKALAEALPARSELKTNSEKFLDKKLSDMGFAEQRAAAEKMGNTPFSRAKKGGGDSAAETAKLEGEFKRLLGDHFGISFVGKEKWAGKWTKDDAGRLKDALISLSGLDAREAKGAIRHEAWHGVEQLLKELGPQGQKVLDTIQQHVDTPMMRKWLETKLKDYPDALKQLDTPGERSAFAFQYFMRDGKMPLHPQTRTWFQAIKDFARKVMGWVGMNTTTDAQRAAEFFKYVGEANFLRDAKNPEAVLRALGETRTDRFAQDVKGSLKPVADALSAVAGHTSNRIRAMNNPHYTELLERWEGKSGKMGYVGTQRAAVNRFANKFAEVMEGKTLDEQNKFIGSKEYAAQIAKPFRAYLDAGGLSKHEVQSLYDKVDAFNQDNIDKNMAEFVKDLTDHGGLPLKNAGDIARVAQEVADKGYFYDGKTKLFEGKENIAEKWITKDPAEQAYRLFDMGTQLVERKAAFGGEKEMAALKAEGDKAASPEQRELMSKVLDAFEGRLGANSLSPGAKKAMSIIMTANNIRMLPFAVFSQMLEPMQLAFRKNDMGGALDSFIRGVSDMPRTFDTINKGAKKDIWEKLAEQTGTIASDIAGSMVSQMTAGYRMGGKTGWLNDKFFKYNFMDQWNRSMHIAATKHAVEFIKDHYKSDVPMSQRFMRELGLTRSDVKIGKDGMLVPNEKVNAAIVQYVNEAMAHPDVGSNTLWMNDPRFALLSHMKRFTFAHSRYILERGIKEYKLGNANVLGPAILAVPWMLAADTLKDAINPMANADYKNGWGFTDRLAHGIERTGALGRFQFPADMESSIAHGGTGMEGLAGPTGDMFGRIVRGAHDGRMLDAMLGNVPGMPMIMPD